MKNRGDPAITLLGLILGQYHDHEPEPHGGVPVAQSDGLFEPRGRMGSPASTGRMSDGKYTDSSASGGHVPSTGEGVNTGGGQVPSARRRWWSPVIFVHEDNTTCISAVSTGKNPTMKTLERCFGVCLAWLSSRMMSGDYNLVHTRSHDMTADIHTKGFDDVGLYRRLRKLNNIFTPEEIANVRGEVSCWNPDPLTFDKKDARLDPTFDL